jgi:8-oxo-dGTP diphosphatase
MPERSPAGEIRAAGAVLWRPAGSGTRVALVHRPRYDDWGFAKGKLEPGEHVLRAAVREVAEETGLPVTLGRRLQPVRYDSDGVPKRVDYWAAEVDPDGRGPGFSANAEIDEVRWLAASAAAGLLSYPRDAETLADFRAGPRHTVPLILVRHASAGGKSDWHSSDETRPLDGRGKKEARLLALLLRCFGVSRVVSSPATRCVATVRPYARSVGEQIETEPAFLAVKSARSNGRSDRDTERPAAETAAAAGKAIASLAAADQPVVVCAHRENLPALLAGACTELGQDQPPDVGKPLRKGEFLVLHRAAGRLAAVERYDLGGRC